MDNDLKDILSNSNKDIGNQELLNYLSNQLSASNSHEIEKAMLDDDFVNDAVEGLHQIKNNKAINIHLEELQAGLKKQIEKKNDRKKRRWKDNPQTYLIVTIVIILIIICFVVIKKQLDSAQILQEKNNLKTISTKVYK